MVWAETRIEDAKQWELLRISTPLGITQGWFLGADYLGDLIDLHHGRRHTAIRPDSVTGVSRPIAGGRIDRLWLALHRSVVEPDGHAYRRGHGPYAYGGRERRRFWIEHYDSNGVMTYLTTARKEHRAQGAIAGFMSGVEGDIDQHILVRMVPLGDSAGAMYLAPLRLSHPPDGRVGLPATVVFRSAYYRRPSERPEPRLMDDEYRLTKWPIESHQPFLVWRYARDDTEA